MWQIVKVYKDWIGYQVLNTDNIWAALEAWDNISIDWNEISAVDTTYSAWTWLSLSWTTFSLNVDYWADLSLSIDPSTFVLTAQLKNQNWGNIWTAQTIDLPLESVVVSWSYNSQTKEVELTLQSGSVIRFSVADLVSWLQEELVVWDWINIDANNEISVDTSIIATKEYVDDSIAESVSAWPTAPLNPTQWMLRYDTVNDVLKSYDWTQWNEVWNESTDINTKSFYLSWTSDLTNAQAAYDWFSAWKNPIVMYNNRAYLVYAQNATQLIFQDIENSAYDQTSYTEYVWQKIIFTLSWNDVTAISYDNTSWWSWPILRTDVNYPTPYTPAYAWSPTTKQYVDNNDTYIWASAPTDNVVEWRLWYDTTNDILKVYDWSWWVITWKVYTAWDHINISNADVISTTGLQEELVAWDNITIEDVCTMESDMRWPCPSGFHVPTISEWTAIKNVWTTLGWWNSDWPNFWIALKLPLMWQIRTNGVEIVRAWNQWFYWWSERKDPYGVGYLSNVIQFHSSGIYPESYEWRAKGCPVRPLKNTPVIPDNSWTMLYGVSISVGWIFWNSTEWLISLSWDWATWITIADKNLWATVVWNDWDTLSQSNCGRYFQRWNNYWFPFTLSMSLSSDRVNTTWYWPWNYYYSDTFVTWYDDWSSPKNDNLWWWQTKSTYQYCIHNVISATDTKYTAWTWISIDSNNVISSTQANAEWWNITWTLSDQTDLQNALNDKADTTDVLEKTNTTSYTPTWDYNPATKKYVDDAVSQAWGGDMLTTVYDPNGVWADAFDYTNFINTPTAWTWIDITNNTISVDNTIAKAADAWNVRRFENTTASLQAMYDWLYNSTWRYGIVQYNNRQDYIFGSTNATDGRVYSAEWYKVTNLSYSGKRLLLDKYNIYYTLNNGSVSWTLGYVSSWAFVGQDVAFAADVLTKTNTTAFTPTADYHPATKKYVDDSIAESVSSWTTAPSNPTEWQLWYDTTNDILKVYDWTNWTAVDTDTTYTAWTWLTLNWTTFSADTTVLATKQDIADLWSFEVVASLPSVSSADTKTIYLLWPIWTGADKYEEWIVTEDSQQQKQWTKIWETSMDLSWYATTSDLTSWLSTKQDTLTASTWINIDSSNNISNTLPWPTIASTAPTGTEWALWYDTTNDVLMAHDWTAWKEAWTQMKVLSYWHSTWQDFLDAYNENAIVYCRASSNSNPWSWVQWRMAFMAFVSLNSSTWVPQNVEFQYYRSRSDHNTQANQLDEVYVYKLESNWTWTVTQRNTWAKAVAWAWINLAFGSGNMTISADTSVLATQTNLNSKQDTLVSWTNIKTVNNESLLWTWNITISAPTYTAGDNITIDQNNEISAVDTTYDAWSWITIWAAHSDMQWPAPDGFHVPSRNEWIALFETLITTFSMARDATTIGTYLKMPLAGDRISSSSNVGGQGTSGRYRSSTPYSTNKAYFVEAYSSTIQRQSMAARTFGLSVRCFKNTPVAPDNDWTMLYDGSSIATWAGVYYNSTLWLISVSWDWQNWLTIADKNLWATTVYNNSDTLSEANCGYYYQRWNNYWFPFTWSVTTSSTQVDASNYWPWNYYNSSTFITVNNWSSVQNDNLWWWVSQWTWVWWDWNTIANTWVLSVNGQTWNVTINTSEASSITTTQPGNPVEWDVYYDTSDDVIKVYDWTNWNATGKEYEAWTGIAIWDLYRDTQWPCPEGFHIPVWNEMQAINDIMEIWESAWYYTTADIQKILHFPSAYPPTPEYAEEITSTSGYWMAYWDDWFKAWYYLPSSGWLYLNEWDDASTAYLSFIRAVKDEPVIPDGSWTRIVWSFQWKWIFWNQTLWLISLSDRTDAGSPRYTIMDKNIWATTVRTYWDTSTEANSGKLFQRWNNYWFPLSWAAWTVTTSTTAVDASWYWPWNYYSSSTLICDDYWEWDSSNNHNLWWWATNWTRIDETWNKIYNTWVLSINWYTNNTNITSWGWIVIWNSNSWITITNSWVTSLNWKTWDISVQEWRWIEFKTWKDYLDIKWPCPEWFHIPTQEEVSTLSNILSIDWSRTTTPDVPDYLHIPAIWYTDKDWNVPSQRQYSAFIWTCTATGTKARWWFLYAISSLDRASMMPIRPFKDEPVVPDSSWTVEYQPDGATWGDTIWVYHSSTLWLISISKDWETWITIADKNLWATQVFADDSATPTAANVGNLYQRGNNYWVPYWTTPTISQTQVDASWYWPIKPYSSSTIIRWSSDRSSIKNDNLWWWVNWIVTLNSAITNTGVLSVNGQTWYVTVASPDMSNYLAKNNTTAFTPSWNYNPATKKYVDDNSFKLAPSSPLTPKYRRYWTQAQYEALSQYYTDTPWDTVYHTT